MQQSQEKEKQELEELGGAKGSISSAVLASPAAFAAFATAAARFSTLRSTSGKFKNDDNAASLSLVSLFSTSSHLSLSLSL